VLVLLMARATTTTAPRGCLCAGGRCHLPSKAKLDWPVTVELRVCQLQCIIFETLRHCRVAPSGTCPNTADIAHMRFIAMLWSYSMRVGGIPSCLLACSDTPAHV
jgi:hypothetical protein